MNDSTQALEYYISHSLDGLNKLRLSEYPSKLLKDYDNTHVRDFIRIAFDASLHTEEGRPTRTRLALGGRDKLINFSHPIEFTPGRIAKLAPIVGLSRRQLVVSLVDESLKIVAIRDPFREIQHYASVIPEANEPDDHLLLSIYGPGKLSLSGLASRVLRIYVEQPSNPLYWTKAMHEWLSTGNGEKLEHFWRNRAMESMIRRIRDEGRGGCVIVVPQDTNLKAFIEGGIGVENYFFSQSIERRIDCQAWFPQAGSPEAPDPYNLNNAHFIENDFERTIELVAALGAIDGAVILSRDWKVLCFGAKLKATNQNNIPTEIKGRGTRHNSAYCLCMAIPNSLAIVISQDGDVSVISANHAIETATLDEAWIDRKY